MDLMLPARDGVKLAATLFEPSTPNGMAILLNSGTGIPRRFYGAFAQHLADRGFAVLTYDYRGIGQSDAPSSAAVEHWGAVDQASIERPLAALAARPSPAAHAGTVVAADPGPHRRHRPLPRLVDRHGKSPRQYCPELGALGALAPLCLRRARSCLAPAQRRRGLSHPLDELR